MSSNSFIFNFSQMKKFIKKIIFFSIIILKITFVLFYMMQIYYNHSFSDKNAIFIWGDSQAYHGIDLEELSAITNKNIYSSAFHGAGVYDFLLFTERISPNSKVIVVGSGENGLPIILGNN